MCSLLVIPHYLSVVVVIAVTEGSASTYICPSHDCEEENGGMVAVLTSIEVGIHAELSGARAGHKNA